MQVNPKSKNVRLVSRVAFYRRRPARDVEFFTAQAGSLGHLFLHLKSTQVRELMSARACQIS